MTVSYTGFTITWNMTSVGITAEAPCSGVGIEGKVYKLCMFYQRAYHAQFINHTLVQICINSTKFHAVIVD